MIVKYSFICFIILKPFWPRLKVRIILYFSNVNQVKKANYHTYKLNNILIGRHSEGGLSPLKLKMVFVVKVKVYFASITHNSACQTWGRPGGRRRAHFLNSVMIEFPVIIGGIWHGALKKCRGRARKSCKTCCFLNLLERIKQEVIRHPLFTATTDNSRPKRNWRPNSYTRTFLLILINNANSPPGDQYRS